MSEKALVLLEQKEVEFYIASSNCHLSQLTVQPVLW